MGNRVSQRAGERIEEVFGWVKTVGGGRKLHYCGVARNWFWTDMTIVVTTWCSWPNCPRWPRRSRDQCALNTADNGGRPLVGPPAALNFPPTRSFATFITPVPRAAYHFDILLGLLLQRIKLC